MSEQEKNLRMRGRAISPGLAIGPAFVYREGMEALADSPDIEAHQVGEEQRRVEQAAEAVAEDLRVSARRIERDANAHLAAIFEVHEAMLQDPELRREINQLIQEEWVRAEHALARVFRRRETKFRQMAEPMYRQHADDVADLARRLLRQMAGVQATSLEKMPPGRVLVARRLLPSDTVALPHRAVLGIVTEVGGAGSHVALLAEAFGIPTVAQVSEAAQKISDNDLLIVEGDQGEVVINPDEATQASYLGENEIVQARLIQLVESARGPAQTRDGTPILVMANVSCREDTVMAAESGADGVGLYRLEQFYLSRRTPPTVQELLNELRETFAPFRGKPITVRLLDLGGDKPLPFLKLPRENNPFLGRRGVRFLLHYPDLLDTQLAALWQFSEEQEARLLVPMVTFAEDMARVRRRLIEVASGSQRTLPLLGAMIETPAAALCVPELIAQADFFSIGTNDLTQYTMAAGREDPTVQEYFQEDHPAVLRLVRLVVEEAGPRPVSLCGELARQLDAIPILLQLGIRSLSVAPPLLPAVKDTVRKVRL